eukprot:s2419_g4.t1
MPALYLFQLLLWCCRTKIINMLLALQLLQFTNKHACCHSAMPLEDWSTGCCLTPFVASFLGGNGLTSFARIGVFGRCKCLKLRCCVAEREKAITAPGPFPVFTAAMTLWEECGVYCKVEILNALTMLPPLFSAALACYMVKRKVWWRSNAAFFLICGWMVMIPFSTASHLYCAFNGRYSHILMRLDQTGILRVAVAGNRIVRGQDGRRATVGGTMRIGLGMGNVRMRVAFTLGDRMRIGRGAMEFRENLNVTIKVKKGYQVIREVEGNAPSGEITSVGDGPGPKEPGGGDDTEAKKSKGKASNSYAPIFRAKPGESYRDWRRSVDFWLGGEGHQIPKEYIGPRIMVQLRDRAAQLVKHLNNSDVNTSDGMNKIFAVLERSPLVKQLDKHRVDQHRKRLMALSRYPGESLESYITRGNIYRNQLLGLDSSLEMGERFYVGHLIDHARLTRRDKALVRTRAGEDSEEAVTNAMVELAAELEGEQGCPIGASEPNVAGANGEEWLVQRPSGGGGYLGKKFNGKAALGAEVAGEFNEEDVEHYETDDQGEESVDGDVPVELMEAQKEAYAMHYRAKQKMAEVKKLRQYYKKENGGEERRRALAEKIRTTACHNCGEIGHWSRECPKANKTHQACVATRAGKKNVVKKASSSLEGIPEQNAENEWDLLVSLCTSNIDGPAAGESARVYMAGPCGVSLNEDEAHEVMWCVHELQGSVILDLGCLKSVAGTKWMNQLLKRWQVAGRWFKVFPEKETFRFGSGNTLPSKFAVQLLATFCGKLVVLSFSVVEGDCPPLLSRPACSQLGAIFDCAQHTLSSRKLKVKGYGLKQTTSGHYIMAIEEFDTLHAVDIPSDFRLEEGIDAQLWAHDQLVSGDSFGSSRAHDVEIEAHVSGGIDGGGAPLPSMRRSRSPKQRLPMHRQRRGDASTASGSTGYGRPERDQPISEGPTVRPSRRGDLHGVDDGGYAETTRPTACSSSGQSMANSGNPYVDGAGWGADLRHGRGRHSGEHPDRGGAEDDREESGQEESCSSQTSRASSPDGLEGGVSFPVAHLEQRGGMQLGGECAQSDDYLPVEEAHLAAASEEGPGRDLSAGEVEEESAMAGNAAGQGGGSAVGTPGSYAPTTPCSDRSGADVRTETQEGSPDVWKLLESPLEDYEPPSQPPMEGDRRRRPFEENMEEETFTSDPTYSTEGTPHTSDQWQEDWESGEGHARRERSEPEPERSPGKEVRPARGLTQDFKKSINAALAVMDKVKAISTWRTDYMVLEVFAKSATLSRRARQRSGWACYEPVDIIYGEEHDMRNPKHAQRLIEVVDQFQPDLVVITPPCGPWCAWQRMRTDFEALDALRSQHLPFWRLARKLWDKQNSGGRLVMTEQPDQSEALDTSYMTGREDLHRVVVDQCEFGLKDPVSGKYYKKATALDVNDEEFARELAQVRRCSHSPDQHEQIKGSVYWQGRWQRRSTLAAVWPVALADHILKAAENTWAPAISAGVSTWRLAEPHTGREWLTVPVEMQPEGVLTPEEVLRRQLNQMGAAGDRYDYVTFEGDARGLPRRVRATLAHLHVVLGHLSNDRLARMLSLAGGNKDLVMGARNMRCQVCCMVRPPDNKPQVSYMKPSNFNQRVSADCFHIWDYANVQYTVFHMIDELTDYEIAELEFDPGSQWISEVVRERWYGTFGPPDELVTDAGKEFCGSVQRLNDLFAVRHEVVPDQAKWRLGHAERHGAILKVMLMKMVAELHLEKLGEMQGAVAAAVSAKNRIVGASGISPLQAVTGRSTPIPASLLAQLVSGNVKFKINEDLDKDEALRRAERIRAGAIEACHWLDAHEGLRRALNAKSRPPNLATLKEGTIVYCYDPPTNRRGLARRLQDNSSWSGPAVVVCVERSEGVPKRVWVRIKTRVKCYPLEKLRLATCDEMVSAEYISGALKDVQEELNKGTLKITEDKEPDAKGQASKQPRTPKPMREGKQPGTPVGGGAMRELRQPGTPSGGAMVREGRPADPPDVRMEGQESSSSSKSSSTSTAEDVRMEAEAKRKELMSDVPQAMKKKKAVEPHQMSFDNKKALFERLAKEFRAPTTMEEAKLRAKMETAFDQLKKVRKAYRKEDKDKSRAAASAGSTRRARPACVVLPTSLEEEIENNGGMDALWSEVEEQAEFWDAESWKGAGGDPIQELLETSEKDASASAHAAFEAKIVTGKQRLEYRWQDLDADWKAAFKDPILKALKVYFDHAAVSGVNKDVIVDPRKILTSRFVLTNKGGTELAEAELKGRWIFGGHRDQELGKYPTMAPTASLLGHNLLNFVAVQMGWEVQYEDVSAAFLQGKRLPAEREVYVKIPQGYPDYVNAFIREMLGSDNRDDLLRLDKGGFGLSESPRLWYLEYKGTLKDIGVEELKLVPGMFRAFHPDGRLRAVVCIHVDDTRYTGDETAQQLWDELHSRLKYGQHRKATEGKTKFCGRYEQQHPVTKEFTYSMQDYIEKIPEVPQYEGDKDTKLTDVERLRLSSLLGQINWAARQGRFDLSYGVSHCQQMIGLGKREAIDWARKLWKRAQEPVDVKIPVLGCPLDDVLVVSASDAAFAAQPNGGSQGGVTCLLAHPDVLEKEAPVAVVEAQSMKIQRIVRCSMSAELSMAAEAFEHGDYIRAVLAELTNHRFELRRWKWYASRWRHYLVIDAKTGYDVLNSECLTSDRKIMIDAAVLREAMTTEGTENYVRWIPGKEMISDGLTKWLDNHVLTRVMMEGKWSLVDTPEARRLRAEAAERIAIASVMVGWALSKCPNFTSFLAVAGVCICGLMWFGPEYLRVHVEWRTVSLAGMVLAYLSPMIWMRDTFDSSIPPLLMCFATGFTLAVFAPLGAYSHPLFHVILIPYTFYVSKSAMNYEQSQESRLLGMDPEMSLEEGSCDEASSVAGSRWAPDLGIEEIRLQVSECWNTGDAKAHEYLVKDPELGELPESQKYDS